MTTTGVSCYWRFAITQQQHIHNTTRDIGRGWNWKSWKWRRDTADLSAEELHNVILQPLA